MNVYDFDKTIYDGDSTLDFYKFCLIRKPYLVLFLPRQILGAILYKIGIIEKTSFKEYFYLFLTGISDIDLLICHFWSKNTYKIKKWYLNQKKEDDIVISASPEFLLQPICDTLKINLIASKVDKHTGKYTGVNCYGEEKVNRLFEKFDSKIEVEKVYTDSLSDLPLMNIAKDAYLVKGNNITLYIKENK